MLKRLHLRVLGMPATIMVVSMLGVFELITAPPLQGPVAAVFPPWWNATQTFQAAAAAGPIIRFGGLRFIVVVQTKHRSMLKKAGAWLLLDPQAFGGCG